MKNELAVAMIVILGLGCLILTGCLQIGAGLIGESIGNAMDEKDKKDKAKKPLDLLQEYVIGENTVQLHIGVYQDRPGYLFTAPGYLFTAIDRNHQVLGRIFYCVAVESENEKYERFRKMDTINTDFRVAKS